MYPCIEAIEWLDGRAQRLEYHQQRVNAAFQCLFPQLQPFDLAAELEPYIMGEKQVAGWSTQHDRIRFPEQGKYKLRILYDEQLRLVELEEYHVRRITTLKLVDIDKASLPYKSSARQAIDAAYAQRGECDDVLLVRDGLLTDTSYANIALFDGWKWISPRIPLLYGTRRAYLLDRQLIDVADIYVTDLPGFQRIRMFNALIDFGELELSVKQIVS